jgi:hypothetical protein
MKKIIGVLLGIMICFILFSNQVYASAQHVNSNLGSHLVTLTGIKNKDGSFGDGISSRYNMNIDDCTNDDSWWIKVFNSKLGGQTAYCLDPRIRHGR